MTTTLPEGTATLTPHGKAGIRVSKELVGKYEKIITEPSLNWTANHRMTRLLGTGGQGVVYLSERCGADGFTLPIALKVFSPKSFSSQLEYECDMKHIASISAKIAQIQHDNLLDVHNLVDQDGIRIMEMEWIDGYDLRQLLTFDMLDRARDLAPLERWQYINNVIVTVGPMQPRLKPGIAIQIIRECLSALACLHRDGIVHGDIKPSNIMLKRTGAAKIIDIGSAIDIMNVPPRRMCSPGYAAPEILEGRESTPRSDLCSLGYVLIEMLSGRPPFANLTSYNDLLEAKRLLAQQLTNILPQEVACNQLLLNFCQRLIAPDPNRRFLDADEADLGREGASHFHRQLVKVDMASEYETDIRCWLEVLE